MARGWNFPEKFLFPRKTVVGVGRERILWATWRGRLGKARGSATVSGGVQNGGAKEWLDPFKARDQG